MKPDPSLIVMAGRGAKKQGRFTRWWNSKKDSHFQIITNVTILSAALFLWGIIFLFLLGGATDPTKADYVPISWVGLVLGTIGLFYTGPEFFVYLGERQILEDILALESRPEILRRRKEGEDAAIMLGTVYMSRFRGLLELHDITVGKNLRVESRPPTKAGSMVSADPDAWWNNSDSILARKLPGLSLLRDESGHRLMILSSSSAIVLLLFNSISGLAKNTLGERNHTIDLTAKFAGETDFHVLAPHFDATSLLLIAFFGMILAMTRPAGNNEEE